MKKILLLLYIVLAPFVLFGQTFTESNLPIVIIDTQSQEIVDEPKISASMKIIYRGIGETNYVSDQNTPAYLNYNGNIGIEIRGSYSQTLWKKSYGLETRTVNPGDGTFVNNNVSILGMPKENDWILNSFAFDPGLVRDPLSYKLFTDMGHYATRGFYVEVLINGEYKGLYFLQEKIKEDGNRVNIEEITPADNTEPNITGGYIIKADKPTGTDNAATFTMFSRSNETTEFLNDTPEAADITSAQDTYIESVFRDLETQTSDGNSSIVNGYPSTIDIPTFVDFMLINEFASNVDAYQISTYFHKDRKGKLRAGPIWDFNFAWGYDLGNRGGRSRTEIWQFDDGNNEGPRFWRKLFENTQFKCYMSKRWNALTQPGQPLNPTRIGTWIDESTSVLLSGAADREKLRWSASWVLADEIAYLKTFIGTRYTWMTTNLGSFDACANPVLPSLVINEIMYNPKGSTDDLEFIEIKNTGSTSADLTGIYFAGLGMSYQFPANSSLAAGAFAVIAINQSAFTTQFGVAPFGVFYRNLANSTQKLTLADAFGNVIDEVEYSDVAPWPVAADGGGKSLELLRTKTATNNLASSWFADAEDLGTPGSENHISSLPVTLVSFSATNEGAYNLIKWQTTAETNNDHFEVERSNNAVHFEKIGEDITGKGNSSQLTSYSLKDYTKGNGAQYYRLKQVDVDNTTTYSKIIVVKNIETEEAIFPNPVRDYLFVKSSEQYGQYSIANIAGHVVRRGTYDKKTGIKVAGLTTGEYLLLIGDKSSKFLKE